MTVCSSPEPWWSMSSTCGAARAGRRNAISSSGRPSPRRRRGLVRTYRGGVRGRPRRSESSARPRLPSYRCVRPWLLEASWGNGPSRFRVRRSNAPDSDVYDALVRLLRPRESAARVEAPRLRGDLPRRRSRLPPDGLRPVGRLDRARRSSSTGRRSVATPSSGASTATAGSTRCSPPDPLPAGPRPADTSGRTTCRGLQRASSRSPCRSGRMARRRVRRP